MAYPVFDLLLLCHARRAWATWSVWQPAVAGSLLGVGFLATGVADVVSAIQAVNGGYVEGGWVDPVWLVGVVALAAASLPATPGRKGGRAQPAHPAQRWLAAGDGGADGRAAASLALLQLGQGDRFPPVAGIFAALCIAGAGLRATLTFRDLARLANVHREARTDDLTRLANRRALYEVMEQALTAAKRAARRRRCC